MYQLQLARRFVLEQHAIELEDYSALLVDTTHQSWQDSAKSYVGITCGIVTNRGSISLSGDIIVARTRHKLDVSHQIRWTKMLVQRIASGKVW